MKGSRASCGFDGPYVRWAFSAGVILGLVYLHLVAARVLCGFQVDGTAVQLGVRAFAELTEQHDLCSVCMHPVIGTVRVACVPACYVHLLVALVHVKLCFNGFAHCECFPAFLR